MSSLKVTYAELRRRIGRYLGWGRDPSGWTQENVNDCEDILTSGLRRFYWPLDEDGRTFDHEWSFLKVTGYLTTIASQGSYDMPNDFGDIVGPFIFIENTWTQSVEIVGIQEVIKMQQFTQGFGRPHRAAFAPQRVDVDLQRWKVHFAPIPEGVYELQYQYNLLPEALLTTTREYPYGGAMFGEVIIESCLSSADLLLQDAPGPHEMSFRRELAAAMSRDGRSNNAEVLGYNGDRSDSQHNDSFRRHDQWPYGRVIYTGNE